jgi:hypothetical protein
MINFQINNINTSNARFTSTPQRNLPAPAENLITARQPAITSPATRPSGTINPLQSYTRINGHTIPRFCLDVYSPLYQPDSPMAKLSHQEWLDSLTPEIRYWVEAYAGIDEMDAGWREHRVFMAELAIKTNDYAEQVKAALTELGEQLGFTLRTISVSLLPTRHTFAMFECITGERNMIMGLFEDGSKLKTIVPSSFSPEDFWTFTNEVMQSLMSQVSDDASANQLRGIFENYFLETFGNAT